MKKKKNLDLTDLGKYFLVDNDPNKRVKLISNKSSYMWNVEYAISKRREDIIEGRLTHSPEEEKAVGKGADQEITTPENEVKIKIDDTPQEMLRVEFRMKQGDKLIIKTLEGKHASTWHEWVQGVCMFAHLHQANPDWVSLKWKIEETDIIQTKSK
jgi:hypothetical protein